MASPKGIRHAGTVLLPSGSFRGSWSRPAKRFEWRGCPIRDTVSRVWTRCPVRDKADHISRTHKKGIARARANSWGHVGSVRAYVQN